MHIASQTRRVLFVINSLGQGGAERVLSNLLARTPPGWAPAVVLLDDETDQRPLPPGIPIARLNARRRLGASIFQLHRNIVAAPPDLVVSFLVRANVATATASRIAGVPSVISERMHLSSHLNAQRQGLARLATKLIVRATYPLADLVIAVSAGVSEDLVQTFSLDPNRIRTLPNPYDLADIAEKAQEHPEVQLPERFIVAAGRLTPSKAFDDLIKAFALSGVAEHLCIAGEGEELVRLMDLCKNLGVANRVHFLGFLRNPFAVVARATMFVSASRYEGFPNAIAEALVLGLPVVATDCLSGPAELLDDSACSRTLGVREGKYGILTAVSSPTLLANAIMMMNEPTRRAKYSAAGKERMRSFGIDAVAARYWSEFDAALDRRLTARRR